MGVIDNASESSTYSLEYKIVITEPLQFSENGPPTAHNKRRTNGINLEYLLECFKDHNIFIDPHDSSKKVRYRIKGSKKETELPLRSDLTNIPGRLILAYCLQGRFPGAFKKHELEINITDKYDGGYGIVWHLNFTTYSNRNQESDAAEVLSQFKKSIEAFYLHETLVNLAKHPR